MQTDEATDFSGIGHLIVYLRYVEGKTIIEDMIFCRPIKIRATEKNTSKLLKIS
jgi:hypothetical protein